MLCLYRIPFPYPDIWLGSAQITVTAGLHTFIDCDSNVVRNIIFAYINDVVARIRPHVSLSTILSFLVG